MKQPNLNREWLEQYKTIPKENTSIYRNTYNPHESSIPGTPQSYFEKAMMPAYGVGTQQMEEQIRAHPAFASMPASIRERPIGDVLNYFKQPEMVNRIKFNQDLEGIKDQRQTNYNNQLSQLQTQHNQRLATIQGQQASQGQSDYPYLYIPPRYHGESRTTVQQAWKNYNDTKTLYKRYFDQNTGEPTEIGKQNGAKASAVRDFMAMAGAPYSSKSGNVLSLNIPGNDFINKYLYGRWGTNIMSKYG